MKTENEYESKHYSATKHKAKASISVFKTINTICVGNIFLLIEFLLVKKYIPDLYNYIEPGVLSVSLVAVFIGVNNYLKNYLKHKNT